MKFGIISLLPEIMESLRYGITGRAQKNGIIEVQCWNPRDFTTDKHQTVDDKPYGGGPGMLMMVEPLAKAIEAAKSALGDKTSVIYLSPQGRTLDHEGVKTLSDKADNLILLAGRYEGIDERVINQYVDAEWSIGDYVLSGGELAACVMIDSITRQLPGSLGDAHSAEQDSFVDGLLDYPHYTRPEHMNGEDVPSVLLSGNHAAINKWRLQQALGRTHQRRPDLLTKRDLTQEEQTLLDDFLKE
tara:strand:+ start:5008 stop:5739 length:732 start_codon:yes stop_codon:yes gene_type:complete